LAVSVAASAVAEIALAQTSLASGAVQVTEAPMVRLPVHCDSCWLMRPDITHEEAPVLMEQGELPCPRCGDVLTYVGESGLADALGVASC
jgi:hypothetical protein